MKIICIVFSSLSWMVYYNDEAPPEAFKDYNPIVFDSEHHPDLKPLLEEKKTVLGYLNVGEAEERQEWFSYVKERGLLYQENSDWPASWSIDIRDPFWTEFVLNTLIPEIVAAGFSGLFLDQLDVPLTLAQKKPEKFKGMREAAIKLVKAIRKKYPELSLMMNRAYEILPEVAMELNFELAETLYTNYNFKTKEASIRPEKEFEWQLEQLKRAKEINPELVIFSLDYWDPDDRPGVQKIYAIEREKGMRPYVSTPLLDKIYPEIPP